MATASEGTPSLSLLCAVTRSFRMLSVHPLRVDYIPLSGYVLSSSQLGVIAFADSFAGADLTIAIPQLGAPMLEVWSSPVAVARGRDGAVSFAHNAEVLFGTISSVDGEIEEASRRAYQEIVRVARRLGYPHLLRVWNHLRALNEGEGDRERYKRFCAGRHEAFATAGFRSGDFPAACGVGMMSGGLAIYFLAARAPGRPVENPRQVSAYRYPRQYGPTSPSFARATVARFNGRSMLFVAGTASVVGHQTRHPGDVTAQTTETLANLGAVAEAAGATVADLRCVKTYLRYREDHDAVLGRLGTAMPAAKFLIVESDICRRDLLVEIEAVGEIDSASRY